MQHLKEKQYYSDLYDTFTIERCREAERFHNELDDSIFDTAEEKPAPEEIARLKFATKELYLYFTTGEQYKEKARTIQRWMERDRQLDHRVETAEEPQLVRCHNCACKMDCTSRDLWSSEDKVQFFFACPNKCLPLRVVYEDGTEYKPKPNLCEKCGTEMSNRSEKIDSLTINTLYTCSKCEHAYTDTLSLATKEQVIDPEFEKDRERFCLSDEKGSKYIQDCENTRQLGELMDQVKAREEKKELYEEVNALKKFTVPQFKAYLISLFESEQYSNLVFEKPDMSRIVSMEFSIEELNTNNEYESKLKLRKFLEKHLESTNWRLMSDGISYRLGILRGRIRVYEDQDELAKLIEKNHGKQ